MNRYLGFAVLISWRAGEEDGINCLADLGWESCVVDWFVGRLLEVSSMGGISWQQREPGRSEKGCASHSQEFISEQRG
jgi:hypothetical protein